jgi:hypothetical protein
MIKLIGKVKKVFDVETFGTFQKRSLWLEEVNEKYANTWNLEFWKEDCSMPDNLKIGDYITCFVDIKGKSYSKKDGSEGVINTLKCWNIEKEGKSFKEIKSNNKVKEESFDEDDDDNFSLF